MSSPTGVGRRLGGRYELLERLAPDPAAEVFKGQDREQRRPVIIKLIQPDATRAENFRARFERETRAVGQLRHPNIAPLLDFGLDGEQAFLVYDLGPGGSLADRLRGRPLTRAEMGHILAGAEAGLSYAHSRGFVHRGLRPRSIVFDARGEALLSDLGLAQILNDDSQTGDVSYLAPEQVRGDQLDERADIYSLGVVTYEMATGRRPFVGATPLNVMLQQLNDPPPPPQSLNPALPPPLAQALTTVLEKNPDARHQTVAEFVAALQLPAARPEPPSGATRMDVAPLEGGTMVDIALPNTGTMVEMRAPATHVSQAQPRVLVETPPGIYASGPQAPFPPPPPVAARRSPLPLIFLGVAGVVVVGVLALVAVVFTVLRGGATGTLNATATAGAVTPSIPSAQAMGQIAAGSYPLGIEGGNNADYLAQRSVDLPNFWIDRYEVTNDQFKVYVTTQSASEPYGWQGGSYPAGEDKHPVRGVSYDLAAAYCAWAGKRLPTEAEWEVAARGPDGLLYPWGDDQAGVSLDPSHTYPVGSVAGNVSPAGIFDMAGNVWEWVADPVEPIEAGRRLLRGGSYNFLQNMAYRLPVDPTVPTSLVDAGFRCAADLAQ